MGSTKQECAKRSGKSAASRGVARGVRLGKQAPVDLLAGAAAFGQVDGPGGAGVAGTQLDHLGIDGHSCPLFARARRRLGWASRIGRRLGRLAAGSVQAFGVRVGICAGVG